MVNNLENAKHLYNNDILVDSLFSNIAYLEPRYLLNAKKITEKTISKYFKDYQVDIDGQNVEKTIENIFNEISSLKPIEEARDSLREGYRLLDKEKNKEESVILSDKDLSNSIRKNILAKTIKLANKNNSIPQEIKAKLNFELEAIPKTKFEEMLNSKHKKESYSLMSTLMEVIVGVNIDNPTSYKGLICKQNAGWFDIGEDNGKDVFEGSFFAGYISNEDPKTLHIGIRGTEKNAAPMAKYMLGDYPNMKRHFNKIKPFLDDLIKQETAKNKNLTVAFSGHSLGAAMTELALAEYKDINSAEHTIKFTGLAIANPGGIHAAQQIMNKLDAADDYLIKEKKDFEEKHNPFVNALNYPVYLTKRATVFAGKSIAFLAVGSVATCLNVLTFVNKKRDDDRLGVLAEKTKNIYDVVLKNVVCQSVGIATYINLAEKISRKIALTTEPYVAKGLEKARDILLGNPIEEPRLVSVIHEQDIIGKIGSITANQKKNKKIIVRTVNNGFEKINEFMKTVTTVYHDNNNYVKLLKDLTDKDKVTSQVNDVISKFRTRTIPEFGSYKI